MAHPESSAQVRRLVAMLRPAAAADEAAREAAVAGACTALAAAFAETPDRRCLFLAEDGGVAIMELLAERSSKARSPYQAYNGGVLHIAPHRVHDCQRRESVPALPMAGSA